MLFSFALIFICGMAFGSIFGKFKLPPLTGMLLAGIIIGPFGLNLLESSMLFISADLRQIALIIILLRAGLNLDLSDLIKVGRPAILMCFVPASFEIIGMLILAPKLLGINLLEAAIMGTVIAAVSPAVIVPKMLKLMEENYGTEKSIPQLILAGASVDDVFVIVLFTSFIAMGQGGSFSPIDFIKIPTAIIFGVIGGIICGFGVTLFFKKFCIRNSLKIIITLSIAFLLVSLEHSITGVIGFSGLLAIMSMGICLQKTSKSVANNLSAKYSKLWIAAELLLFVLVGASVNIKYALSSSGAAVLLIFGVLLFRLLGVYICMLRTNITNKERLFCMIAYTPKATVQAAIGSTALNSGLPCGEIVLTIAVLAILITAPLGAFAIETTYKRLLKNRINNI